MTAVVVSIFFSIIPILPLYNIVVSFIALYTIGIHSPFPTEHELGTVSRKDGAIFRIRSAPYDRLFPLCAAAVGREGLGFRV